MLEKNVYEITTITWVLGSLQSNIYYWKRLVLAKIKIFWLGPYVRTFLKCMKYWQRVELIAIEISILLLEVWKKSPKVEIIYFCFCETISLDKLIFPFIVTLYSTTSNLCRTCNFMFAYKWLSLFTLWPRGRRFSPTFRCTGFTQVFIPFLGVYPIWGMHHGPIKLTKYNFGKILNGQWQPNSSSNKKLQKTKKFNIL